MDDIKICEYGCGRIARFQLKNKKWCCSKNTSSCEVVRAKNSEGLRKAHKDGKLKGFSIEVSDKGRETRRMRLYRDFLENPDRYYASSKIRHYLNLSGRNYICEICGVSIWNEKPITLEVDHIDGNHSNNRLSNLRYLCPNCHSQTNTYKGRNTNTGRKLVSDDILKRALDETKNIRQALIMVGLAPKGANYLRAKELQGLKSP